MNLLSVYTNEITADCWIPSEICAIWATVSLLSNTIKMPSKQPTISLIWGPAQVNMAEKLLPRVRHKPFKAIQIH